MADGFAMIKLKVGASIVTWTYDGFALPARRWARTCVLLSTPIRRWGVDEASSWLETLAAYDPYWIEEPTSPDDILGHAAHPPGDHSDQGGHW